MNRLKIMKPYKIICLFLFSITYISAQTGGSLSFSDARSVAMGSPFAVTSTGVYSVHSNPANLTLMETKFQISTILPFPSINVASQDDYLTYNELDYYFGGIIDAQGNLVGRYLDNIEKQELLSKFDNENELRTHVALNLLSFAFSPGKEIGTFAFSIDEFAGERATIPKDLVDFALFGNEIGRNYDFSQLRLTSSYTREYSLSYARDFSSLFDNIFKSFSAGISLKLIKGYLYTDIERADLNITTLDDYPIQVNNNFLANIAASPDFGIEWDFDDTEKSSNISPFPTPAGSGFGINLGFAAELDSIWTFGLSITDLGSMNWDTETVIYSANGSYLITAIADSTLSDSLDAIITPSGRYSDGFSSDLPFALRAGATFRLDRFLRGNFPGKMLIAIGYNQGFNNSINNSTTPHFSVGMEWKIIDTLPIRTGLAFGGVDGFGWSLGLGLDVGFLELNIASSNIISQLQGNDTHLLQFTLGSVWKF